MSCSAYGGGWSHRLRIASKAGRARYDYGRLCQNRTTPRSSSLQREQREMALMKVLVENGCIAKEIIDETTKNRLLGETPVLFRIETDLVQSLCVKASCLKDSTAVRERFEKKITELVQRVHIDSVMGSAVPCSKNSDDIIIRASAKNGTQCGNRSIPKTVLLKDSACGTRIVSDTNLGHLIGQTDAVFDKRHLLDSVLMCSAQDVKSAEGSNGPAGGPNKEQVELMFHRLSEEMPNFFEQSHDYSMYAQDLEFDNRLMGVKTKGLAAYKATVQSLKLASTAYLVNVDLEVLRLTMEPEQGCIHARWRLKGVPLHSYILRPLAKKHRLRYFDAFSIFQVGPEGLITHHRLDKVMPDTEKVKEPSLVTRIGVALGLVRPPAISTNWMTGDPPHV